MIISDKYKLIFIKVPRTSSTSIESCLSDVLKLSKNPMVHPTNGRRRYMHVGDILLDADVREPYSIDLGTHTTAKEVKRLIPKHKWDGYYKCAFVRNPWDWVASQYCWNFWMHRGDYRNYLPKPGDFTAHRAKGVIKLLRGNLANDGDIQTQHSFIYDDAGNLLVDFVGRFEDRNNGLRHIFKMIGAPTQDFNKHIYRTPNSDIGYRDFYTGESRRLVDAALSKDIMAFGYKF